MPILPQNGHPEKNPPWHAGPSQDRPEIATPKKDGINPHAPPEKQFGNHNDSQEARPGTREDEWKPPSNR